MTEFEKWKKKYHLEDLVENMVLVDSGKKLIESINTAVQVAFEDGQKSVERKWIKYSDKKPPYKSEKSRTDKGITKVQDWFLCAVRFGVSEVEIMPLQWDYDKKRFEFCGDSDYDKKVVAWQKMPEIPGDDK